MPNHSYTVKVQSSVLLGPGPDVPIPREQRLVDDQDEFDSPIHQHSTFLWGGAGLLFKGQNPAEMVCPAEEHVPEGAYLTASVDIDGTSVDLFTCTKAHNKTTYFGRLKPGQVAIIKLHGLHGVAALCTDPPGSDSKVTCVLTMPSGS